MYRESESEAFPELYVGDYFADTLHLSAVEHGVLRRLLMQLWLEQLRLGDDEQLSAAAGVSLPAWREFRPVILPLVVSAELRIRESIAELRAIEGQRLRSSAWSVVRRIVFERDWHACVYCGSRDDLQVDHAVPLSRGGSNGFENLITACERCNLSKGEAIGRMARVADCPPMTRVAAIAGRWISARWRGYPS